MTKTLEAVVRRRWLSPEEAVREVVAFERRFGEEHLKLACHCGLLLILTPELVNLVRINFLERENIPWIAESNFLLSSLCRPLQEGIYEVEPCIREVLLVELENKFGWQRPFELAEFLWYYLDKQGSRKQIPELKQVQQWVAKAYLKPDSTIREFKAILDENLSCDNERINLENQGSKISHLIEILADPLEATNLWDEYQYLVNTSRAVTKLLVGEKEGLREDLGESTEIELEEGEFVLISPVIEEFFRDIEVNNLVNQNKSATNINYHLEIIQRAKEQNDTKLDLSYPNILNYQLSEIPAEVFELLQLQSLKISGHKLTSISSKIAQLKYLKHLNLSRNNLTSIPESIYESSSLKILHLSKNKLTNLPISIGQLSHLIILNLSSNKLSALPESISQLSNLSKLYLGNNKLTTLPETITYLTNLAKLNLSSNQLTTLSEAISNLSNLAKLNLRNNQLTKIPEAITRLPNLSRLYLEKNQLTEIPETLVNLTNLSRLNLSNNQIKEIPEAIIHLPYLSELYLENNPLENPPLEIAKQGIETIREYFQKLKEESYDTIYEAKLIIVGEGGAGKTTLMNKILDASYTVPQAENATHGIEVTPFNFSLDNDTNFRVNIWDFGGQEIYHQTHQLFLTKRSLYLLVIDSRKEHTNLDYWLNIIEFLSDGSPILIINNEKSDLSVYIRDESEIRSRFPSVKAILRTNLETNRGLENIVESIKYYVQTLPHTGIKIPKLLANVRKALEQDNRDYISLEEYLQICDDNDYTSSLSSFEEKTNNESSLKKDTPQRARDKRLLLSQFLHDLGIILHFQDDEESPLYDTIILNPEWATNAVYQLLNNNSVKNNLGKFTFQDLKNIWRDQRYQRKYRELLELMKRFKLCYELPNNTYIAPQLLNYNAPSYDWNNKNNINLLYQYDFMPRGILTRFIVEMHSLIKEPYVWRNGVILQRDNTFAKIIETYSDREISIMTQGNNKRSLLEIITAKFDEIHNSYYRLRVNTLIPCNCPTCLTQQKPHYYVLENLRKRLSYNQLTIQCHNPPYYGVSIYSLIDASYLRRQLGDQNKS